MKKKGEDDNHTTKTEKREKKNKEVSSLSSKGACK
jgi:hypothetical protein